MKPLILPLIITFWKGTLSEEVIGIILWESSQSGQSYGISSFLHAQIQDKHVMFLKERKTPEKSTLNPKIDSVQNYSGRRRRKVSKSSLDQ